MNLAELKQREHYVYRTWDIDGHLLYVGCSLDVKKRLGEHKANHRWFDEMTNVSVEGPYSYAEARRIEWDAIHSEGPLHNAQTAEYREFRRQQHDHFEMVAALAQANGVPWPEAFAQARRACDIELPTYAEYIEARKAALA